MSFRVIFAPEAADQLVALHDYIAQAASPDVALRYTQAVVSTCERLAHFPMRGTRRDDVRPSLRITHHRKRTVIAFEVDAQAGTVAILGIFHGGRNYEALLTAP